MNRIKAELQWDIESSYEDEFFFNGEDECIRPLDLEDCLVKCLATVERHAVGFMVWRSSLNLQDANLTLQELFKQYLEHINKL